jgi:hypothetical protein
MLFCEFIAPISAFFVQKIGRRWVRTINSLKN